MKKHLLFVIALISFSFNSFGINYYIDYVNGNDSNDGLSTSTAWKHCPGDDQATVNAASADLQPGDNIYFKGEVTYRGSITITNSGTEADPISYIGNEWPNLENSKATISGADPLELTWTQCSSGDLPDNPNYTNIYWASLPEAYNLFGHQFFLDNEQIFPAQDPNLSDPFWEDRISEFYRVSLNNITRTSIVDSSFFIQNDTAYWNNSYVLIWVRPNVIEIREITKYIPQEYKIQFDSLPREAIYGDRDQFYSIVNHIDFLDREGEFVIDNEQQKIFLWPSVSIDQASLSISQRSCGIDIYGQSNLIIEGFVVTGFTSENNALGIANNKTWGDRAQNIILRNNEVTNIKTKDGRKGSISIIYMENVLLENNWVYNCQRNSAVMISSRSVTARSNKLQKCGYKGFWVMGGDNVVIENNDVSDFYGTHATGISIFDSKDVLVTKNKFYNSGGLLSFEDDTNLIITNNINYFIGDSNGSDMVRDNHAMNGGYLIVTNNTVINSAKNVAFAFGPGDLDTTKVIVRNNITDGWSNASIHCQTSNNIYTGLSWNQMERYGWYLMPGESVVEDLSLIFQNPGKYNYKLMESGPAVDAGVDITTELPASVLSEISETFPKFSFNTDYLGRPRGNGTAWDLGAYEFYIEDTSTTINSLSNEGLDFFIYPNPAYDYIMVQTHDRASPQYTAYLYNITGTLLKTIEINDIKTRIDLQNYPSGVYYLQMVVRTPCMASMQQTTLKIIKK
ncbi:MAG: right-handed parallel beta-helix repeat-containing protein [Bacteroidales bacterium]|nr:right-handed parallel beta-helix repeat-containing protein [Bacteroidales bacterium]